MTAHNIPVPAPVCLGYSEIDQYPQDALDNAAIVIETMGTLLSSLDQHSDVLGSYDTRDGVNMILKAAAAQVKLATYHISRKLDDLEPRETYPRFAAAELNPLRGKPVNLEPGWDDYLWHSAAEWAAMELPGLPSDRAAALRFFGRDSSDADAGRVRRSDAGCDHYHVTALPQPAQDEFYRRMKDSGRAAEPAHRSASA